MWLEQELDQARHERRRRRRRRRTSNTKKKKKKKKKQKKKKKNQEKTLKCTKIAFSFLYRIVVQRPLQWATTLTANRHRLKPKYPSYGFLGPAWLSVGPMNRLVGLCVPLSWRSPMKPKTALSGRRPILARVLARWPMADLGSTYPGWRILGPMLDARLAACILPT